MNTEKNNKADKLPVLCNNWKNIVILQNL